ncbi:hypothetical protein GLOIN_2v1884114 [Rhizophagus irregularis DAOM 181602=DAOM 197198]|nr:hypothetical protein GLOIN_2v1884114 [Rhizophagus irregularis DAOM 181602=DAOM 197198]
MSLPILNPVIILEIIKNEVTVSVLWENPFRYLRYHNLNGNHRMYSIIETYINFLNEEECNEINQIIKNQEFNFQDIRKAIDSWYRIFKEKKFNIRHRLLNCGCEGYIMKSIMRQCQKLDFLNWGICLLDEGLLKIMQDKIKDLKYFTIDHHCGYYYETLGKKGIFDCLKNHLSLIIDDICNDIITQKEFISFIKLQNDLNEFILNHVKKNYEYKDFITSTIEFQANNLTKGILNEQAINNDTLIVLTKSCPNIYSLSISKTSSKSIKMVLSYLKDLKLATLTLQLFQIEKKGIVMKSKDLLNYIENEKSLFKLGLGKNDKYWDYYNVEILINF